MDVKCPHCEDIVEIDNHMMLTASRLAGAIQKCPSCGGYFDVYFKVRFLGCSTYGCNLYPADGETEESMLNAGVEVFD